MSSPGKRSGTVSVRPSLAGALALAGLPALTGALVLAGVLPGAGATPGAAAQSGTGEVRPYTDASVPARNVTMIGATPREAPEETWGVGESGSRTVLVHYIQGSGWSLAQELQLPGGAFKLDASPLAGQMTPQGDGVLLGTLTREGAGSAPAVLVRSPGGQFAEAPAVPVESETPSPAKNRC